jgi:hypothetical protein
MRGTAEKSGLSGELNRYDIKIVLTTFIVHQIQSACTKHISLLQSDPSLPLSTGIRRPQQPPLST